MAVMSGASLSTPSASDWVPSLMHQRRSYFGGTVSEAGTLLRQHDDEMDAAASTGSMARRAAAFELAAFIFGVEATDVAKRYSDRQAGRLRPLQTYKTM